MKAPKFKAGDSVVVKSYLPDSITRKFWKIGDSFIIGDDMNGLYQSNEKYKHPCPVFEDELEFEHVYNSPLYKALL